MTSSPSPCPMASNSSRPALRRGSLAQRRSRFPRNSRSWSATRSLNSASPLWWSVALQANTPPRRALPEGFQPDAAPLRCAPARTHGGFAEGHDIRRLHRPAETHRLQKSRRLRSRHADAGDPATRRDAYPRTALSQRPLHVGDRRALQGMHGRRHHALRRGRNTPHHRATEGRHRLHGADHDAPRLGAAGRHPHSLRPVEPARALASRRALPGMAQGALHRLARRRRDLGALRRHRRSGLDDHPGHGVAHAIAARSANQSTPAR